MSGPLLEHCPSCGEDIPARARFCPRCGQLFNATSGESSAALPELGALAVSEAPDSSSGIIGGAASPQSGVPSIPNIPPGPQSGAPGVPGAPAGPQAGTPGVPSAPAGPQAGAPHVPGTPAGSLSGHGPTILRAVGKGAARGLRYKLLGTVQGKVVAGMLAAAVVATAGITIARLQNHPVQGSTPRPAATSTPTVTLLLIGAFVSNSTPKADDTIVITVIVHRGQGPQGGALVNLNVHSANGQPIAQINSQIKPQQTAADGFAAFQITFTNLPLHQRVLADVTVTYNGQTYQKLDVISFTPGGP